MDKCKITNKVSLKLLLVLMVLAIVAVPLSTKAAAGKIKAGDEGFLNPFDLTVSAFSFKSAAYKAQPSVTGLENANSASAIAATVPISSATSETLIMLARPRPTPYRPRPRSLIYFP